MLRFLERAFVWTGGALFVLSLALTGWLYARGFVRPAAEPSLSAVAIDIGLLTLFGAHHSAFARAGVKQRIARYVPDRLIRSTYVWVASLLLILVVAGWQPIGGTLYRATGLMRLPLLLVQVGGVLLIVGAARAIRALELAGIDAPRPRRNELQVRGPYALIRHPLYLGWIMAVGGTTHMTGDRLLFNLVTTAYIALAIPWEERDLRREFGSAYQQYLDRVRWRVMPFVY